MLKLSRGEARRFLLAYHFAPRTIADVFAHLGSVQVDPLNPLGRNHDLVLQARVPDYRRGDWEGVAYGERLVYDAWDKQACLVPVTDWPHRRVYHAHYRPRWDERVLTPHADAGAETLAEVRARGPLSSLEFESKRRVEAWAGSWYGPKLVKQVLRALWDTGQLVTHHREGGRHVYDLPENVLPAELVNAPDISRDTSLKHLILRRHQNVGLLRTNADGALWSLPVPSADRKKLLQDLVAEGALVPAQIEGSAQRYHLLTGSQAFLDQTVPAEVRFLAPLDNLVWDRKMLAELFGFAYIWEVYKPEPLRKWGYYVLPVVCGDRFVARVDSRFKNGVWYITNWWWEPDVTVTAATLRALEEAVRRFCRYLGADAIELPSDLEPKARSAFEAGRP